MPNSNLPATQKTNWTSSEYVMPIDTNGWGTAINKLAEIIPTYASNGSFYTVTSSSANAIVLAPVIFTDNTQNQTPNSYINGMNVWFLANANNTGSTTVNVNGLGVRTIYNINNTVLKAKDIKSGYFVHLIYNSTNNRFYLVSADVLPELTGHSGQFLSNNGSTVFWDDIPSPIEISYET